MPLVEQRQIGFPVAKLMAVNSISEPEKAADTAVKFWFFACSGTAGIPELKVVSSVTNASSQQDQAT